MLARVFLPPFALQLICLTLGFALSSYSEWLDERFVANLSDQSGGEIDDTAFFFWVLGVGGMLIFMPLHWLLQWGARRLRVPAGLPYVFATLLVGMAGFLPHDFAPALVAFFAPCIGFMGLADWGTRVWCRRQEAAEQRATDAFVLARKKTLQRSPKP
jgi:hypothetical protein